MRGHFQHVPGVLARSTEIAYLDGGSGRTMITEMPNPGLIEGGPVALQILHEDTDPDDVVKARADRRQNCSEISEEPIGLGGGGFGTVIRDRIVTKQGRHEDPARALDRLRHRAGVGRAPDVSISFIGHLLLPFVDVLVKGPACVTSGGVTSPALHEAVLPPPTELDRAGLREAGLREAGFREAGLHEAALPESGLHRFLADCFPASGSGPLMLTVSIRTGGDQGKARFRRAGAGGNEQK